MFLVLCVSTYGIGMEKNDSKSVKIKKSKSSKRIDVLSSAQHDYSQKQLKKHLALHKQEVEQQAELIELQKRIVHAQERIADAQELRAVIETLLRYDDMRKHRDALDLPQSHMGKQKLRDSRKIPDKYTELKLLDRYTQLVNKIRSSNTAE